MMLRGRQTIGVQVKFSVKYVLRQLSALGLQPKSLYDAIRMFDAIVRNQGLRAKGEKIPWINFPKRRSIIYRAVVVQ